MKRVFCLAVAVVLVVSMAVPAFAAISINDLFLQALDLVYSRGGGVVPSSYAYYLLFLTSSVTSDNRVTIMFSETPVVSAESPVVVYRYSGNGGSPAIWSGSYVRSMVRDTDAAVFIRIRHSGSVADGTPVDAEKYIANLSTARIYDQLAVEDGLKALSPDLTWERTINVSLPDTSALQALVNASNQVEDIGYTSESWSLFHQRLSEAVEVLGRDFYTVPVINTVYGNLLSAKDSLDLVPVSFPDTTILENYLQSAKQIENDGFTLSSWSALQAAILNAESLLTLSEFSEADVSEALNGLQSAIGGLRYPPSASGLESLINRASQLNASDYTPESWSALQSALSHAMSLLASGNYTSGELAQAQSNLNRSMASLVWKSFENPPAPDGHRYLVDGLLPSDLSIAHDAIFENIGFARDAGIWVFGLMFVLYISIRIVRSWVGVQGESKYIKFNSPLE